MSHALMIGLALLLCGQQYTEAKQHNFRTNKVWSVTINYRKCDVEITKAEQGLWNISDNSFGPFSPAPLNKAIFQWNHVLPKEQNKNFKMMDMLMRMAKDRTYYLGIYGVVEREPFLQRLWITPMGISTKAITTEPPVRDYNALWTEEEEAKALKWIEDNHKIYYPRLFNEYILLKEKMDHRISVDLVVGKGECK